MSSEQFISSSSFDEVMKRKSSLCPTEKNSLVSKEQNHHFNLQQKYRGKNRFPFSFCYYFLLVREKKREKKWRRKEKMERGENRTLFRTTKLQNSFSTSVFAHVFLSADVERFPKFFDFFFF